MEKRRLSFWEIWNTSFGFLGIQMGFALQNANASRILQIFGADVHELSWFWIIAPLMGLIVQPIIGHYSDKTWGKFGRRKPSFSRCFISLNWFNIDAASRNFYYASSRLMGWYRNADDHRMRHSILLWNLSEH